MELKYGLTQTYKFKLSEEQLNLLVDKTNRSKDQTQFLFNLVDGDFERLKELETKLKNCFYAGCPTDKETVNHIMNMQLKNEWFSL